jgi:hypothetical protein
VNPPMGQVIGGWIGAMVVLGIAGGWLFGPTEVTLHTVPVAPSTSTRTPPAPAADPGVDAQRAAQPEGGQERP